MPFCLTVEMTSAENFASRSKIKNRCGRSYPQAAKSEPSTIAQVSTRFAGQIVRIAEEFMQPLAIT